MSKTIKIEMPLSVAKALLRMTHNRLDTIRGWRDDDKRDGAEMIYEDLAKRLEAAAFDDGEVANA